MPSNTSSIPSIHLSIYPNIIFTQSHLPSADPHLQLGRQDRLHPLLDSVQVFTRGDVVLLALLAASKREILGHDALLVDNMDASLLEALGKLDNLGRAVELTTLGKTTGPSKDGRNGVGRRGVSLLVLAEMPSNGTVSGFCLERLAVRCNQHGGHKTKTAKALGDNVGLDITIVVCHKLTRAYNFR